MSPGRTSASGSSLGGPRTYAFDSDGDGVADVCSLTDHPPGPPWLVRTLWRLLVAIGSTLSRTDAGSMTVKLMLLMAVARWTTAPLRSALLPWLLAR